MTKTIEQLKNEWIEAGISNYEGFFRRSDGMIEIEDNVGTQEGEYYDQVSIITESEAWDILFDSDDFRIEIEREAVQE